MSHKAGAKRHMHGRSDTCTGETKSTPKKRHIHGLKDIRMNETTHAPAKRRTRTRGTLTFESCVGSTSPLARMYTPTNGAVRREFHSSLCVAHNSNGFAFSRFLFFLPQAGERWLAKYNGVSSGPFRERETRITAVPKSTHSFEHDTERLSQQLGKKKKRRRVVSR